MQKQENNMPEIWPGETTGLVIDRDKQKTGNIEKIQRVRVSAYTIPTETPEEDGTLGWNSTTLVLVEIFAGEKKGIGYTYADSSAAKLIRDSLAMLVTEQNAFDVCGITGSLIRAVRNNGNTGLAMMAVSAIDNALWDLKAKLLGIPLCALLGGVTDSITVYGSGGFTNYSDYQLQEQLTGWMSMGIKHVKIKIGRDASADIRRVKLSREIIGDDVGLFVDANGAYSVKQAMALAETFALYGVSWLEEPVTSDDTQGLQFIRSHSPAGMHIAAGEYGFNLSYFKNMLASGAVDILQADATRCGGITGFLKTAVLSESFQTTFSSHCAPSVHLHAALSVPCFYLAEYFFDHTRIESMLFDGAAVCKNGKLIPDRERPGLGIEFKYTDAEKYKL